MTRCPRTSCRQEFYGVDGCRALFCHKCCCSFCAICFKDCGNDAHSCARACLAKHFLTESESIGSLGYFLPTADLELRETVFQAIHPMLKGFGGCDDVQYVIELLKNQIYNSNDPSLSPQVST
jgi:hypothetical protein